MSEVVRDVERRSLGVVGLVADGKRVAARDELLELREADRGGRALEDVVAVVAVRRGRAAVREVIACRACRPDRDDAASGRRLRRHEAHRSSNSPWLVAVELVVAIQILEHDRVNIRVRDIGRHVEADLVRGQRGAVDIAA